MTSLKHYDLGKQLGSGSFGVIYAAINRATGEKVAIKMENVKCEHPQLEYESKVYLMVDGGVGIPMTKWLGVEDETRVMVMELLGPSIETLFNYCHRRFSLKTVLMLADLMIRRVEHVHSRGLVHRDIKPDNFVMGAHGSRARKLYLIDFGLAKKYAADDGTHIPYVEHKRFAGTVRYASIDSQMGNEASRRNDLEAIGHVLMYLLRGSLPWQGMRCKNSMQKQVKVREKIISVPVEELCAGFPQEFETYIKYTRSLQFEQKPDYDYVRGIFKALGDRMLFAYDWVFDWAIVRAAEAHTPRAITSKHRTEKTRHAHKK